MPESKRDTRRSSVEDQTDWAKVDAHVIQPDEYEDAPDLSDVAPETGDFHVGDRLVRPRSGPPPFVGRTEEVTLRLDADVLARYRASGPGWQSRMNAALREALDRDGTS
ncbi:MAG: BrnA antitoxin family protein [Methylobacterium sp.]|uniref:BrnA antitoxin family protein n=1 Tax=Methylobacterium sp. TaxID=409 RepID=UPI00258289C2|nr:BrnA antitoxin family protein [Methylobacterium sp.]MBY0296633.1 BrnA antitoxin family protein [Methylobacterium sp.]